MLKITRYTISSNDMYENVLKAFLKQGLISEILVCETFPSKGKPAKKDLGTTTVWIIKCKFDNNQMSILEAARGGPREWASLDNLNNWLKECGVTNYTINHIINPQELLQQRLAFVDKG